MKSFLLLFKRSAQSLSDLRTLTTVGILLAAAVAIHSLGIQITPDIRITFSFLFICIIGMLYGPVVCGMASFSLDLIGFLFDNKTHNGYSPQLALILTLSGIIYGLFLYRKEINYIFIIISRLVVVLICNICLNSYVIYTLFVNKDFSIFKNGSVGLNEFFIWLLPRVVKNLVQLPVDIVLLCIFLPVALMAYKKINKTVKPKGI